MNRSAIVLLISIAGVLSGLCFGQGASTKQINRTDLSVQEFPGGSVVTDLGFGIQVNKGSTLQRRWFVINDPEAPIQLSSSGIKTKYKSRQYGGDYIYEPSGSAQTSQGVAAYEIRFLLFDVWGQHVRTLSLTKVADTTGQFELSDGSSWRAWEDEVSELQTVVSFVARAKTNDGHIWTYSPNKLLRELERIKVTLTEKELNPEREKPKS